MTAVVLNLLVLHVNTPKLALNSLGKFLFIQLIKLLDYKIVLHKWSYDYPTQNLVQFREYRC